MKVKELMSAQVEFITPETTTKEAAHIMHDLHLGVLPVVEMNSWLALLPTVIFAAK